MKAVETNLLKFLQGTRQFVIPIYQRTYSWNTKQCEQLWNDLMKAARDDSYHGHFIGSIVYIERGLYNITSVPQVLVIDGQQRLTTISLILAALGKALDKAASQEINRKKIENYYLYNSEESGELRYKLLLTQVDKDTLKRIVDGGEVLPPAPSNRVLENFQYFESKIKNSGLDLSSIYKGLSKLIIVDIALDRERDNPQLIFESLNSTGLDLSQADLIRNYILMGLETKDQEEIYQKYWHPMECSFGQEQYIEHFDYFMRDYLTIKLGHIPNLREVYIEFKDLVSKDRGRSIKEVVVDIHHYSQLYCQLAFARTEDPELRSTMEGINSLKTDVAYPFLLTVLDDYYGSKISKQDLLQILRLVESYVLRRNICGIPTNSLNKTFANLRKQVRSESYVESIMATFALMESYRGMPKDEEFRQHFEVKDVYNSRIVSYILDKLENYNHKEKVSLPNYSIEHIMPQKEQLTEEWQRELGENWQQIHGKYLHTIGNLTLTGYNSELGYSSFRKKQEMEGGFRDSHIRLNRSLASIDAWNEEEIRKRASHLSQLAAEVWPYPSLSEEVLDKYREKEQTGSRKTYKLEDHNDNLYGVGLEQFSILRDRIKRLDPQVREEIKKLYVAYKLDTNFVDLVPWKGEMYIALNMPYPKLIDPLKKAVDAPRGTHYGNGDVSIHLTSTDDIDYVMTLIKQSLDWQVNGDS